MILRMTHICSAFGRALGTRASVASPSLHSVWNHVPDSPAVGPQYKTTLRSDVVEMPRSLLFAVVCVFCFGVGRDLSELA